MLMFLLITLIFLLITFSLIIKLSTVWDKSPTCLVGKTAIVTGANTGIGFYTAQDFAKRGAKVILACRDRGRAESAKKKIIETTDNLNVHVRIVDLSSLQSVRDFAEHIRREEDRLDILVNNAGVLLFDDIITPDGLSLSMQVNHFGPFLLTLLLVGLLKKSAPSRIVNVSSASAFWAKLKVNNLNHFSLNPFAKLTVFNYANTKLCNILFTNELARRLRGSGVTVNSLHPGAVYTEINRNCGKFFLEFGKFLRYLLKTSEEGSQTTIYVAVSKDLTNVSGEYFDCCKISRMPSSAQDVELAKKIWVDSEKFVNLSDEEQIL